MTTSALSGNILAGDAIGGSVTMTGGTVTGRVLANVAVTMTGANVVGCAAGPGSPPSSCKPEKDHGHNKDKHDKKCNQGVGNGPEGCDPGKSDAHWPFNGSNDENGGTPGDPGRKGGK